MDKVRQGRGAGERRPEGTSPAAPTLPGDARAPSSGFRHAACLVPGARVFLDATGAIAQERRFGPLGALGPLCANKGLSSQTRTALAEARGLRSAARAPAGRGRWGGELGRPGEDAAARWCRLLTGARGTGACPKGARRSRGLSPGERSFPEGCAQARISSEQGELGEPGLQPPSSALSQPPLLCNPLRSPQRQDELSGKKSRGRQEPGKPGFKSCSASCHLGS